MFEGASALWASSWTSPAGTPSALRESRSLLCRPSIGNSGSQPMRFSLRALLSVIAVIGIAIAGLLYAYWNKAVPIAAMAINYVRYLSAPVGTLETEVAPTGAARNRRPRRLRHRRRLVLAKPMKTGQATTRRSPRTASRS